MDAALLNTLVEALYQTVLDPKAWKHVPLTLARGFNSESCYVQTRDLQTMQVSTVGGTANVTAEAARQYEAYYWQRDIWEPRFKPFGTGRTVIGADVATDSEVRESEFYRDFTRHIEMFDCVGGLYQLEENSAFAVGIHRPERAPAFGAAEKRTLGVLMPHVQRALQISRRLGDTVVREHVAFDALDRLGIMTLIVAGDRRLVFANAIAQRLFRNGRILRVRHGLVHCANAALDARFLAAIATAAGRSVGRASSAGGVLPIQDSEDGQRYSMLISPLPQGAIREGPTQPLAAVFVTEPGDRRRHPEAIVAALYRLTPAESRLVVALMRGETLQNYAERSALAHSTVKFQLKQVFAKTGHRRQSEILGELLANPILRMVSTTAP